MHLPCQRLPHEYKLFTFRLLRLIDRLIAYETSSVFGKRPSHRWNHNKPRSHSSRIRRPAGRILVVATNGTDNSHRCAADNREPITRRFAPLAFRLPTSLPPAHLLSLVQRAGRCPSSPIEYSRGWLLCRSCPVRPCHEYRSRVYLTRSKSPPPDCSGPVSGCGNSYLARRG